MILVTGATGTVGRHVIMELHQAGCEVRALCRNPGKAEFPSGVETAAGDLTKPDTVRAALEGVEKVFWVLPMNDDFQFPRIAREHGVRHIVLLSSLAAEFGMDNAIARLPGAFRVKSIQLVVLVILMFVTADLSSDIGFLSALHPVFAAVMFWIAITLVKLASDFRKANRPS
ncbi:SDR family oxidoreductase [Paenibacillus humicola]|uniref:SDR family oxidoreductase n=1 Tax=Paenibacillus humicola TaxID=3110540 RepID=UPI00237AD2B2|nr:NAD(P)H-binding protein [Paenibacillus humicola]